jgi:mannose-1-phosphate guanylyltransferase / mannose-6-phosphate isomerase
VLRRRHAAHARPERTDRSNSCTASVTIGDSVRMLHENESVYVPSGAKRRLENPGKIDLELIEMQTGSYLGEDDIERIEDDYHSS